MPRDALKIKTSVPQNYVLAGRPFTLTTTMMNPFDEKIDVIQLTYNIPFQVQWIHDKTFDQQFYLRKDMPWWKRLVTRTPLQQAASPPGQMMYFGLLEGPNAGQPVFQISPGEARNYSMRAVLPQWLFVTGGQISFQGTLIYKVGAESHTSVFDVTFPFRPPLKAITFGAVVGAILGVSARLLTSGNAALAKMHFGEIVAAAGLSIILATVGVVFSSRRSIEVQPVFAVEDVWGGMMLGFLIGYLGNEFFQKIIPNISESAAK